MKKVLLAVCFITATLLSSFAQTCTQELASCEFGGAAASQTCQIVYNVTADGNFMVNHGNSLCGSRGIFVSVKVNHRKVFRRLVQHNDPAITFSASAGDVITVDAAPGPVDRNIICVWAGIGTVTLCTTE